MPIRDPFGPDRDRERSRERGPDRDLDRRHADPNRPADDFRQGDFSDGYGRDEPQREPYRGDEPRVRREQDGDWHYAEEGPDDRRNWHYADGADDRVRRDGPDRDPDRSLFDQARDRVEGFFGGAVGGSPADRAARQHRQDRVTWAVITGRMDHERRLDSRDIEVLVHGSEVTLNGTVRSREEKRLAEDLVDVRGITHVQNNLRIHKSFWR